MLNSLYLLWAQKNWNGFSDVFVIKFHKGVEGSKFKGSKGKFLVTFGLTGALEWP